MYFIITALRAPTVLRIIFGTLKSLWYRNILFVRFYHPYPILTSLVHYASFHVTGEEYCFPRRQLIFSFDRRVIYHRKVFESTFRSQFSQSVCTAIFKRIAGLSFYPKYFMLCINGFVSTSSTKKLNVFF